MAYTSTSNNKLCATCACWCGNRTTTDRSNQWVEVASPMTKGKCGSPSSPWKNTDKQANASCNKWQKWPVLK